MNNKVFNKVIIVIIAMLFIVALVPKNTLAVTPANITGQAPEGVDTDVEMSFVNNIEGLLRTIGIFVAAGAMMVIGIKYMSGSIEEKANYKKTMMPYLIGCILLFGASILAPMIVDMFSEAKTAEDIGNTALGAIQVVGTIMSVLALMILGIKYMLGSAEEKASYKKSMMPYLIGAVLVFGAVNITAVIYDMVSNVGDEAHADAMAFINNHKDDLGAILTESQETKRRAIKEEQLGLLDKKDVEEMRRYADILYQYWKAHRNDGK